MIQNYFRWILLYYCLFLSKNVFVQWMIFSWIDGFNHYNISFIISMVSYPIDLFPLTTWSSHSPCKIKTTWNKFKCVLIYILLLSYRHVEILKRLNSFEKGHIIQLNSNGRSTNIIIHKLWRSFFDNYLLSLLGFVLMDILHVSNPLDERGRQLQEMLF